MNIGVWPFLVGCNRILGYHVIVSPQFLSDTARSHLLFQVTGGDDTTPRSATAREIRGSEVGTITVIFRVVRAQAQEYGIEGNDVLKDRVGRPIRLFEGVVAQGGIEDIQKFVLTQKDLQIAHEQVKKAYQAFWVAKEDFSEQISQSFALQASANVANQVTLKVEPPLEIPSLLATDGSNARLTKASDRPSPVHTKNGTTSITRAKKEQARPISSQQSIHLPIPASITYHRNNSILFKKRKFSPTRIFSLIPIALTTTIILLSFFLFQFINYFQPTPTPIMPIGIGKDGIGVTLVDGEYIGISDGGYALDINRPSRDLMLEASDSLRKGNLGPALAGWGSAHEKDTNNAEPLIYAENQRVLTSGSPYISIVLGVSLGEKVYDGFSRDAIQAAYIAQKECNKNPQLSGGKKLRLLIARSGSNPDRSKDIAKQIVQAAQSDKTIVGVEGWTTSVTTLNALQTLVRAHLPIVSSDNTSDELTHISPYYFRISTPNSAQTPLSATYIEKKLAPQRFVIFTDPQEPFSSSLSADLVQQLAKDGYKNPSTVNFKTADETGLAQKVQEALKTYNPDLLYITTNTVGDVTTLLNAIPSTQQYANLKVFAEGAGYELVQTEEKFNGYARILISGSAFPDEWKILGQGNQEPPFFNDYSTAYDPHNQHITDHPYGYRRANSEVMMDYDALRVFLEANKMAIQQGKQNPTPDDIKSALSQINGAQSFQGITGVISFGSDGDPIDRLHFILRVADGEHLHAAAYQGCFLVGSECDNSIHILE